MATATRRRRAARPRSDSTAAAAPVGHEVVLFCKEADSLKLGPSDSRNTDYNIPGALIVFDRHFARFNAKDFPEWESWITHPGTPHIEVLEAGDEQVEDGTVGAVICPVCDRSFASEFALKGHKRSHAR